MIWKWSDGGRREAGYKGTADGDCGVRAASIAMDRPYKEVYDELVEYGKAETKRFVKYRHDTRSHPRTGVWVETMKKYMADHSWVWVPTMGIGTGCKVHLTENELPLGRLMVRVSKHYTAVIDGVVHDLYDPSREGTRCCYGYWKEDDAG